MKKRLEVSLAEAKEIIKNTRHLPDNERPVFLYMKQHNVTGLLYFGRTVKDPYKYKGSGKKWKRHLKKCGSDILTIWLRMYENEDCEQLATMARRISNELNIVESERFANTRIETGHNKAKELPSQEYLQECFDYNRDTGELTWKTRPLHHFKSEARCKHWNSRFSNKLAGCISKSSGYIDVGLDGKHYKVHRIIWKLLKNEELPAVIDHIDGNESNNRIENLRGASKEENNRNCIKRKNNTTGFTGVNYRKDCNNFQAIIRYNGKPISLGSFVTAEEASLAYQKASLELHGEFSSVTQEEYEYNLKNTKISERKVAKGYCYIKPNNNYRAYIPYNGKQKVLGYFKTEEEASQAHKNAMLEYHGIIV
jgi:hypothetical protein